MKLSNCHIIIIILSMILLHDFQNGSFENGTSYYTTLIYWHIQKGHFDLYKISFDLLTQLAQWLWFFIKIETRLYMTRFRERVNMLWSKLTCHLIETHLPLDGDSHVTVCKLTCHVYGSE